MGMTTLADQLLETLQLRSEAIVWSGKGDLCHCFNY